MGSCNFLKMPLMCFLFKLVYQFHIIHFMVTAQGCKQRKKELHWGPWGGGQRGGREFNFHFRIYWYTFKN